MKPFSITKITETIWQISETYYSEFAHMYLLRGSKFDLLVDSGLGLFDPRAFLQSLDINPKVFITHAHYDHIGGLGYFANTEVLMHPLVRSNIQNIEVWGLEYFRAKDFLWGNSQSQSLCYEAINERLRRLSGKLANVEEYQAPMIYNGTHECRILSMPGHTNDSLCLWLPKEKILISGDVLYSGNLYCTCINSDKEAYMHTLEQLEAMDVHMTLPGHNSVLDKKATLQAIRDWKKDLTQK